MNFTKEDINNYADNLLINLTDAENDLIFKEFTNIQENMEIIANFKDLNNVLPMTFPFSIPIKLRDDIATESDKIEDVLKNCKQIEGRENEIPKVVG